MQEDLRSLVEARDRALRDVVAAREAGRYLGSAHQVVAISGHTLDLTVHFADVAGYVTCVGVDLRSFVSEGEGGAVDIASVQPLTRWSEITTVLLRQLPLGQHIDSAIKMIDKIGETGSWRLVDSDDDALAAELGRQTAERFQAGVGQPRRRGPKPLLDDQALARVVAPAYRAGGRKPVVAVQRALLESGLLRDHVTMEQARKAVVAARARGFIPPAKPRGQGGRVS